MKDDTTLAHAGRDPFANHGIVNPPVYHASTVLFPTMDQYLGRGGTETRVKYGRRGTPTIFALEDAMTELEGGHGAVLAPSGLCAISMTLMAVLKPGDHLLVTDSTYAPTRKFADTMLARIGVQTEYYDPLIGEGIARLIRPNTRLVWLESPGSQTFDVQDVPAIVAAAKRAGALTAIDNTWAAGYFLKPLALGVDIAVHACTKYVVGHSDAMMGAIVCDQATYDQVKESTQMFGVCAGPDDVYLALRGFRSMGARLKLHHANGLRVAQWLQERPEVIRVMHPGLPQDPVHALWKLDFTGASGLFGFVVDTQDQTRVAAMLDGLKYFGMGASWGGFESLILPTYPEKNRSASPWAPGGHSIRIHIGLEDPDDLIADLDEGFARLRGT